MLSFNTVTMRVIHIIVKRFLLTLITASCVVYFKKTFLFRFLSWYQRITYEPCAVATLYSYVLNLYSYVFPSNEEFQCDTCIRHKSFQKGMKWRKSLFARVRRSKLTKTMIKYFWVKIVRKKLVSFRVLSRGFCMLHFHMEQIFFIPILKIIRRTSSHWSQIYYLLWFETTFFEFSGFLFPLGCRCWFIPYVISTFV